MAQRTDVLIQKAVRDIAASRRTVALTGAGVSVASGIPPFRGNGGLWERFDPMEVGHIAAFLKDPETVWNTLFLELHRVLKSAEPNRAHTGFARLERLGSLDTVITQNIDGLHQKAGSSNVIEFHGTFAWQRCMDCDQRIPSRTVDLSSVPPRCACGGIFRPDCVLFGEQIPTVALESAQQAAAECDVLIVAGTSATVQPAAMIPDIARAAGGLVIEINTDATPLTGSVSDYWIQGSAGSTLSRMVSALSALIAKE